jgi:hypothetical protein
VTLPLPARTKFLLIHLFAGAPPDTTKATPFPGPFADSTTIKLRRVPSVKEVLAAE